MIIHKYVYPHRTRLYTLTAFGDFHLGHTGCDKKKLEKDIKWIARQRNMGVFIMGDLLDICIPYISPERFYYYNEVDPELNTFEKAYDYLVWLLRPIEDKIVGIHAGNHDFQWIQKSQYNYVKNLAKTLNATYLDFEAITKLVIGKKTSTSFDIYSVHGAYTGRKIGGKINRLTDIASAFIADIYIMGHVHELGGWRTVKYGLDPYGKLIEKKQAYVFSGTYFKSHIPETSSYAERRQYPPNKIGLITIEIYPRERDIHVKE